MFSRQFTLMEKHRASELWAELHALVVIAPRYTIVELSLADMLVIRPQYQKIVRRTVAHLPILSDSGRFRVKSIVNA